MKRRASFLLFLVAAISLSVQMIYRTRLENSLLIQQMKQQESAAIKGLQKEWRSFLFKKVDKGLLPETYSLTFNRQGTALRNPFLPQIPVSMDWSKYRDYINKKSDDDIKSFLTKAVEKHNSWDRALALGEWQKQFNEILPTENGFEESIVDPEARNAYKLIFEQFSKGNDFTYAMHAVDFDVVYYRVNEDGSLVGFVPSIASLSDPFLREFMDKRSIGKASLAESPWNVRVDQLSDLHLRFNYTNILWFATSVIAIIMGISLYLSGISVERKKVLKRMSFLNQVIHELKSPLTGLKLHLQLIQAGVSSEENLQALNTSIDRLDELFDNIVLVNRPVKKMDLDYVDGEQLDQTLDKLSHEFGDTVTMYGRGAYIMKTDLKRLYIILRNLVKNGVLYGTNVRLHLRNADNFVEIIVDDDGPGISLEDSQHIFDEFYQSNNSRDKKTSGLGLGLYIAKKLSDEISASICLANPGQPHAKFKLMIPRG